MENSHNLLFLIYFIGFRSDTIYYFILALIAIALASFPKKISMLVAAIIGAWTFLLRHWSTSNLPQSNTLLTHSYTIVGAYILIWGLCWKLLFLWALILTIPTIFAIRWVFKVLSIFSLKGALPNAVAKYWSRKIKKIDEAQASKW